MKMQIDTTAKTIKIEGDVKLSVLFDHLQKFFPGGEWEDYDLQTNTVINNWASPIIINKPYQWQYETPVYITPGYTLTTESFGGPIAIDMSNAPLPEVATSGYCQTVGIYNIELN